MSGSIQTFLHCYSYLIQQEVYYEESIHAAWELLFDGQQAPREFPRDFGHEVILADLPKTYPCILLDSAVRQNDEFVGWLAKVHQEQWRTESVLTYTSESVGNRAFTLLKGSTISSCGLECVKHCARSSMISLRAEHSSSLLSRHWLTHPTQRMEDYCFCRCGSLFVLELCCRALSRQRDNTTFLHTHFAHQPPGQCVLFSIKRRLDMNSFSHAHAYEIEAIHQLDYALLTRAQCRFTHLSNNTLLLTLPDDVCSAVSPVIGFLNKEQRTMVIHKTRHILLPSRLEVLIQAVEQNSTDETEQRSRNVTMTIPSSGDCHFATALQCEQEGWYTTYEQAKREFDLLILSLEQRNDSRQEKFLPD